MREQRVRPTLAGADGEDLVWPQLGALIDDLSAVAPGALAGVGIGSAGPLDLVAGTVSPVNIPAWRAFPLVEHVRRQAGLPVRLAGDGICAAVGEHWLGAARGVDDVIVIVVSTGVGGGIIQLGRLHQGRSGNAGHIGHMVVDLDGEPCPCGGAAAWRPCPAGRRWCPGRCARVAAARKRVDGGGTAASARAGDPVAVAAFERAARSLAAGITSVAAAGDLTDAVIGGGVAQAADVLLPPLRAAIAEYARLDFVRDLRVGVAELGGAAGLYGAAALIHDPARYGGPFPDPAAGQRGGGRCCRAARAGAWCPRSCRPGCRR
ncbi:ROK family protein [Luedemannella flava]